MLIRWVALGKPNLLTGGAEEMEGGHQLAHGLGAHAVRRQPAWQCSGMQGGHLINK